jgi:hypothetical protein
MNNDMNEDLINKLVTTQNELMAAATRQHAALEDQRLKMEELMRTVVSGQATIAAQQLRIDQLQGEAEKNTVMENGGPSKRFVIKPPKPEFYKGKRDALEINAWIDQIERYAKYFGLSEGMELVEFAVFYLGGSARDWWTNRSTQLKEKIVGWKDFITELKISFYPLDHQRSVMDKLEKLAQKGSVAAYVEKFEKLRTQVDGISEDLWKRYFIKGLQNHIQIEAIKFNLDEPHASFAEMYQRLTTLGDALWAQKGTSRSYPMDLSVIYKTNGKEYAGTASRGQNKSFQRGNQKDKTCFGCGQLGHFKRDCTKRNSYNKEAKLNEINSNSKTKTEDALMADREEKSNQDF